MVLCDVSLLGGDFLPTWCLLSLLGLVTVFITSGTVFNWGGYARPTYALWQRKTNPKYPTPEKVRDEIVQMLKGLWAATLCPTLSLWLSKRGLSKGYCSLDAIDAPHNAAATPYTTSMQYLVLQFAIIWVGSDFLEFAYHRVGHTFSAAWHVHKHHHKFYNPSPFSVIADEYVDQFMRATPLILFPMIMPIDMDLLFGIYTIFFYIYVSEKMCEANVLPLNATVTVGVPFHFSLL